jgi:hypothetical protein
VSDADEEYQNRQIGRAGNRPEDFDQRLEKIVEDAIVAHQHAERHAQEYRQGVAEHLSPQRCQEMPDQGAVCDVLVPRGKDAGDRRPRWRIKHVERRELPEAKEQKNEAHARYARAFQPVHYAIAHDASVRPATTCSTIKR